MKYCVFGSVSLYVSGLCYVWYLRNHEAEEFNPRFFCMLTVAVAWSSFDGVAIRYVLPV